MRPYISIDLETTGLDTEKSEVLQIGAVLDNVEFAVEELPTLNILIDNGTIKYAETGALSMNGWIFKEIQNKDTTYTIHEPQKALRHLAGLILLGAEYAEAYDRKQGRKPRKKIEVAGKNVSGFDLPLLINYTKRVKEDEETTKSTRNAKLFLNTVDQYVSHRTIDPGSMYYESFGRVPNLTEINDIVNNGGRKEVSHDALDDALDVVKAIRHKMGHIV